MILLNNYIFLGLLGLVATKLIAMEPIDCPLVINTNKTITVHCSDGIIQNVPLSLFNYSFVLKSMFSDLGSEVQDLSELTIENMDCETLDIILSFLTLINPDTRANSTKEIGYLKNQIESAGPLGRLNRQELIIKIWIALEHYDFAILRLPIALYIATNIEEFFPYHWFYARFPPSVPSEFKIILEKTYFIAWGEELDKQNIVLFLSDLVNWGILPKYYGTVGNLTLYSYIHELVAQGDFDDIKKLISSFDKTEIFFRSAATLKRKALDIFIKRVRQLDMGRRKYWAKKFPPLQFEVVIPPTLGVVGL